MPLKRLSLAVFLGLTMFFLFLLSACDIVNNKDPDSVSSGTWSGYGSTGGGPATNIALSAASTNLYTGATTTITVVVTDAQERRTDASILLNSSLGGTFNGNAVLNGTTSGGIMTVDYKAPSVAGEDEVTAQVIGTSIKRTLIISISGAASSSE
jgi:hypothetical protein